MVAPCGEVQNMNDWQSTWLGRRSLPRDLSGFEIEAFFTFCGNERRAIEERRGPALKIALALQIGFRRMTGATAGSGAHGPARIVATLGYAIRRRHPGSGVAAREALVQLGQVLRTVFLAEYFVNAAFRREVRRVLNRSESANPLKRAIYAGRVASYPAKQSEEMQAVADALSLRANLVMAWNTMQMQSILDRWNVRRATAVPPELIGRTAPTPPTEGIDLRGVFSFPIEQYAERLLPSLSAAKSGPAAAS
jgi:hypothetical protein